MSKGDWRNDATIIRMMKLRKRHVRIALERVERERKKADPPRPCATCGLDAMPVYEHGHYKGHECSAGHFFYVTKRVRDPSTPIIPTEKADPRGMPSGGHAPPPMSPQEIKNALAHQQQIQSRILKKTGEKSWLDQ
jgi:hypothetical protein